jgi:flagellar biosynthesis/type III secretory pathway protein FliH
LSEDQEARDLACRRRVAELEYESGLNEARAEGEAKGRAEGEAKGLQEAIRHLCQLFEIELTPTREEHLSQSTVQELIELHGAIAGDRAWPESKGPDKF